MAGDREREGDAPTAGWDYLWEYNLVIHKLLQRDHLMFPQ